MENGLLLTNEPLICYTYFSGIVQWRERPPYKGLIKVQFLLPLFN